MRTKKFKLWDEYTHQLVFNSGNETLCKKGFTMDMGYWTRKFTLYRSKVTCPECLEQSTKN